MFIAIVLLNICHSGRIMPGKEFEFPSRNERKAIGEIQQDISIQLASNEVVRLKNISNPNNEDWEEDMELTIGRHHWVSDI